MTSAGFGFDRWSAFPVYARYAPDRPLVEAVGPQLLEVGCGEVDDKIRSGLAQPTLSKSSVNCF